jgi:hypothetical protein
MFCSYKHSSHSRTPMNCSFEIFHYFRFDVLTALATKIAVVWGVMPLILVEIYRRFGGTCCSILYPYDKGKAFFRTVGKFLLHYTTLYYTTLHYTTLYYTTRNRIHLYVLFLAALTVTLMHSKKYTLSISQSLWNFPRKIYVL